MKSHIYDAAGHADKKYYLRCETDAEGIRRFLETPASQREGIELCRTRVEGKMVPALKYEVDRVTYLSTMHEEWKQEDRIRQDARCTIRTDKGTVKRCPCRVINPDYTTDGEKVKTLPVSCDSCPYQDQIIQEPPRAIPTSCLDTITDDGSDIPYDPETPDDYNLADDYLTLLEQFVSYIREACPRHPEYARLVDLLGHDYSIKEAARIMGKPQSTLYGWIRRIRILYAEMCGG